VRARGWTERYAYDSVRNVTHATWPAPATDTTPDTAQGQRDYQGTVTRRAGNTHHEHDTQGRITLRQQARPSAKPRTWRHLGPRRPHDRGHHPGRDPYQAEHFAVAATRRPRRNGMDNECGRCSKRRTS
jgi:hypothetical protein